jgi:dCMP deaminase
MALDKWDARFLQVAKLAAEWSKDPKAQVGAVIVDPQGQVAGVGYNGFPKRVEDSADRLSDKKVKNEMIVHAEENAVIGAGVRARGGTIYVVGKPVCPRCAGTIIQAGLRCVVAEPPTSGTDSHWDEVGKYSIDMFDEANVEFKPTSN